MADFVYDIAKGRAAAWADAINANSPDTGAGLVIELINTTATDTTLKRLATFAAVEADANTAELTSGTNANYARKTIDDTQGITITVDTTNDRVDVDCADQTWTALGAGTAITDLVFGFDTILGSGTDSAIKPVTQHDFAVTPDGTDVTATVAVFYRAS